VPRQNKESAYSPPNPFLDLSQILCIEETRKIGNDCTVSWQGGRYCIVDEQYPYGSFEAIFRTDLEGHTRVFVRGREVGVELIEGPVREPVPTLEKADIDKRVYDKMLRLVDSVHTAVREHKVTGKPLKIPRAKRGA
jgi:hypothetical protein